MLIIMGNTSLIFVIEQGEINRVIYIAARIFLCPPPFIWYGAHSPAIAGRVSELLM